MNAEQLKFVNGLLKRYNSDLYVKNQSVYDHVVRIGTPKWERMEFLGDAVINLAAAHDGFCNFSECDEGFLSKYRTSLVRGNTLTKLFRSCDLHVLLPDPVLASNSDKLLEDTFEAFVAAIYIDNDFEAACKWFSALVHEKLTNESRPRSLDVLKRKVRGHVAVKHNLVERRWFCVVTVDGQAIGSGEGADKDSAIESACNDALTR